MKTELLIGCGNNRKKKMHPEGFPEWENLITLDISEDCRPDVVHDLEKFPYPFEDNTFDEIHAYEVLEHTGTQGDWKFFFDQFEELHRILKPGGRIFGTVPLWSSIWAWGDPSHKRVLSRASLTFLSQAEYDKQVGETAMTDFREYYKADFNFLHVKEEKDTFGFVLEAVK
jgi:SAM-dependent methyltransferase